ncbi:MAG: DNA repair protein RadC [Alistipes sp.]|nr:DNA repair protein RadC [Alistipes sp.]
MRNIQDKLLSRGVAHLDDEELLAAFLADGATDDGAVQLAKELLAQCGGSLQRLADSDVARLRMLAGLGLRRAVQLKAAVEIGRRVAVADSQSIDTITSDSDVVKIMEPLIGALPHEECWALYLASSGKIVDKVRISQGGVQATVVDYRMVLKRALEVLAVQVVLVHNHPSGSAEPSAQDRQLTERVAEGCRLFDIRLLDHVIIARGAHYSFRAHGEV